MTVIDRLVKETHEGAEKLFITRDEVRELAKHLQSLDKEGKYTSLEWYIHLVENQALCFMNVPVEIKDESN